MSADNWTYCPQCKKNREVKRAAQKRRAEKSYGKVSPEEYDRLLAAANDETELEDTLREDYELGVDDIGHFYVSYRASCEQCDFAFTFKHDQVVTLK